jgi:hypothetical protein
VLCESCEMFPGCWHPTRTRAVMWLRRGLLASSLPKVKQTSGAQHAKDVLYDGIALLVHFLATRRLPGCLRITAGIAQAYHASSPRTAYGSQHLAETPPSRSLHKLSALRVEARHLGPQIERLPNRL